MPAFNGYQYKPLCADEARFVVLQPAKSCNDPLSCSIIQCRRSVERLEYCAVSYAWGEPEFSENLEINHDGDTSYLRITSNVDALLRRLRDLKVQKPLWIDAICINQEDEDEKAQQVPLMGCIYGEAKSVHIWVGRDDPMTWAVFKFIRKACRLPQGEQVKMAFQMATLMRKIFGGGDGLRGLRYLMAFTDRSWFTRRWIIQEACLAQCATVHCGRFSIPLSSLVLMATRFQTLDMSHYPIKLITQLYRPTKKVTIFELLYNFHEARCRHPKDRIAALYGLVPVEYRVSLDYTAQWTELYKQVAMGSLRLGNNDTRLQVLLHLFEFGSSSRPGDDFYPSWVPDWSQSRRRALPYSSHIRTTDTFEAYPSSPGHLDKATVTFQNDIFQVHWHASFSRLRARKVIYARTIDSPLENKHKNSEDVLKILSELFPDTSSSIPQLFVLSHLIDIIVEFRHSNRDQPFNCPLFDAYIANIHNQARAKDRSHHDRSLNPLKKLSSLLHEFSLFKLEPTDLGSGANEAYGIGTQQIQVGDVMIPLWSPNLRSEWRNSPLNQDEGSIHISTMLAVRCIGKQPRQHANGAPGDRKEAGTGRIIGSAVCFLLESMRHGNLSTDTSSNEQCSMRLI